MINHKTFMQKLLSFAIHKATMSFTRTMSNNLVTWNYEDLYLHGMLGYLEMPLEDVAGKCKDTVLDFAPVKPETNRDFLAAFGYQPPIDFTLVRMHDGESSIVTYSLNKDATEHVIARFIQDTNFKPIAPTSSFVAEVGVIAEIVEIDTYSDMKKVTEIEKVDFEKLFGMVRYAHFLNAYCHISSPESQRRAAKRFGLDQVFTS